MSGAEFREWQVFDELYGLPDAYLVAAAICTTLDGHWNEKPREVGAILPYFADTGPGRSSRDLAAKFMAMAKRMKTS